VQKEEETKRQWTALTEFLDWPSIPIPTYLYLFYFYPLPEPGFVSPPRCDRCAVGERLGLLIIMLLVEEKMVVVV